MRDKITIQIEGVDYSYLPEKAYVKGGHVHCKTCHERIDGEVMEFLGNKMIFTRQCKCQRDEEIRQKQIERATRVQLLKDCCFTSEKQKGYTFENCIIENRAVNLAMKFVDNYEEMRKNNMGIIFCGTVGSGKSYLACAIANGIMEKYLYSCKMRNFSEIINDLQNGGFELDKNNYINSFVSVELLVLDDLGMERDTAYALEQVYNVINARSLKGKPTIMTTNMSVEQIKNENENLDYKRIYSRVLEMCIPILLKGDDIRKQIHKEKIEVAKELF